ncbi:MAG: host attachment protein [Roseomonas sp.]|nr:host attachment protein [Roseomonas sp.]
MILIMVPRIVTVLHFAWAMNARSWGDRTMPKIVEWALVADAQHARILERRGGAAWTEWPEPLAVAPRNPPAHGHGSDRPGRAHESLGSARHAVEPRQDLHRAAETKFARHLADELEKAALAERYDSLLLVAPPVFLGDLRKALGDATHRRLRGSLDKDIAEASLAVIIPHLDEVRPA